MKKFLLIVLAALAVLSASAQSTVETDEALAAYIHANRYRTGVNTNPYEYIPVAETPVPKGYKPFYISHYGRHGSRSDWDGDYSEILALYEKAHKAGVLSEAGEEAYGIIQGIYEKHNGMNGRLTPRGAREHRAIAHRMYEKYRKVFTKGSRHIRAVSSTVPRCIVSMAAFTGELLSIDPKLDVSWDSGERFMEYCSSNDPDDVLKEAYVLIGKHAESFDGDTLSFQKRVFKDVEAARAVVGSGVRFMEGTLEFAVISGAFDYDTFLLDLFDEDILVHYAKNISLNLFLRQCNSAEFGDRRMAVPGVLNLVNDFVVKADEAIQTGDYAADLRFGHDYQLLAFCARIGIRGIGERLSAEKAVNWPGYFFSPFAGNVQAVFYRDKDNDILVKFFINERETSLITLPGGPYYHWEDIREIFLSYLKS